MQLLKFKLRLSLDDELFGQSKQFNEKRLIYHMESGFEIYDLCFKQINMVP